jgi:hypothetical protein
VEAHQAEQAPKPRRQETVCAGHDDAGPNSGQRTPVPGHSLADVEPRGILEGRRFGPAEP